MAVGQDNPFIPPVEEFVYSEDFTYLARFFTENKTYCNLPQGTIQHLEFWKDVKDKCINGMTNIHGISITGPHFFYLNFCRILGENPKTGRKTKIFPKFVDIDYEYFHMVDYCRKNGKNLVAVKGRRGGWSYKGAALATNEFTFYPESKNIIGAFFGNYSQGTMDMCLDNLNWLAENTPFGHIRNPNLRDSVMSKYEKNINGIKVWAGYHSTIESYSFKDRPSAVVGKSASWLLLDEAGLFPNITEAWGYTEPLIKDGSNATGNAVIYGSSGDMDSGSRYFYEMFTDPAKYNMLEFEDPDNPQIKIGFFSSATKGRWGVCKNPNSKWYKQPMVDANGNSNQLAAADDLEFERARARSGNDPKAYHAAVTQYPTTWKEAFLRNKSNVFGSPDMLEWLGTLENTPSLRSQAQVGELYFNTEAKLKWKPNDELIAITDFPIKASSNINTTGAITIWEHPEVVEEQTPSWLYIAGCLTPGEKVPTDKGLKNVEEVDSNDKLINKDGEEVSINTFLRYDKINEPIFKINMSSVDRPTTYTQEHPLYLADEINGDYEFIKAKDAKVGMWTKYPNFYSKVKNIDNNLWDKFKQPFTPPIENPLNKEDFWWFVGHWLGDGFSHSHNKNHNIYNSFGLNETEYINKYKSIVKNIFNRNPNHKRQNGSGTHCFGSAQLYKFLEENFGKYADGKFIANWVKYIPHNLKLQLILGYLDSDGSVYIDSQKHTICSFKSVNKVLLNDIQDILFSIGILSRFNESSKPSNYNINGKVGSTKQAYSLKINTTELKKLSEKYNTDYNSRKLRIAKEIKLLQAVRKNTTCIMGEDNKYIYIKIKSIEESTYTGVVYNFDCQTHTFVCQYCTTHNCDPYDQDKSESGSLGSFMIYKRFYQAGKTHDILVAEYTGRPEKADQFYENCRKLCIYYNARCLYENQLVGLKVYFEMKNSLYLLFESPGIIKDIVKDSRVQRGYGIHMNRGSNGANGIKDQCEIYLKQWLYEENTDINGTKFLNFHTIKSIPLLKELIAYDREINTDRVIAFMLCILQTKELHRIHVEELSNSNSFSNSFLEKFYKKNTILNKGKLSSAFRR